MSLKLIAFKNLKWNSISSIFVIVNQLVLILVLAKLLTIEEFGIIGIIMAFTSLLHSFSDLGLGSAIIHKQTSTQEELSTLYFISLMAGVLQLIIINFSAPYIAYFFSIEILAPLIKLTSIVFVIIPIGQQFNLLLQRELKFNIIAKIEIISTLISTISVLSFTYYGYGVYSIIYGLIIQHSIKSFIYFILGYQKHKLRFCFNLKGVIYYLKFRIFQIGERIIIVLSNYLDILFISKFLGSEILGYYTLGTQLVMTPFQKINPIFTKVLFPVLSRLQTNIESLKNAYFKSLKIIVIITFLLVMLIAINAESFINLFFGEKWMSSINIIQLISLLALLKSRHNPNGSLLLAIGRADLGFKWHLFTLSISFIVMLTMIKHGIYPLIISLIILNLFFWYLSYFTLYKNSIGECFHEYFIETS
ncbi:MAG: MOP flippase family protein [Calditrichae bacterium]|nr:MOP flippase family protein [Calditrichia bacterium]